MSNEMKIIMERWDRFVVSEEKKKNTFVTWAILEDALRIAVKAKENKEFADKIKNALLDGSIEGGSEIAENTIKLALSFLDIGTSFVKPGITAAKLIGSMVSAYARAPDEKTSGNPILDLFNLDDGFQELIDDKLEDKFVAQMIARVQQEVEKNPDQLIPDFDEVVQAWLPKQNLAGTTDNNVIKQKEKK